MNWNDMYLTNSDNSNTQNIVNSLLIFFAFIIVLLVVSFVRKLYYYFKYKKRFYIIPRVSVKGISIIAMVISISIAIIVLLTFATADVMAVIFRAWPGTRVTLEGILIKIGGLLFGPIIGAFIGAMTDLLAVALTAGVFHYGYLIAAMAYGLIGGLIRSFFAVAKNKKINFAIISTVILSILTVGMLAYLYGIESLKDGVAIPILGTISQAVIVWYVVGFCLSCIALIWICYTIQTIQDKKNKKKWTWFNSFIPVLVASIMCELVVNILMLPSFDAELSTIPYQQWVVIRSLLLIPMTVLNVVIIFPIFKIVVPLINYDYTKELVEPIKTPIYVE